MRAEWEEPKLAAVEWEEPKLAAAEWEEPKLVGGVIADCCSGRSQRQQT